MSKKINNDVIVIELPVEQFIYLKKVTEVRDIDFVFDKNELSIHIIVPGMSAIDIQIKAEKIIPTNDEITAELCTAGECLSPGRGLFSRDVLDQIIKADDITTFMWKLVEIIKSGIDSSFYKVHIGTKVFELIQTTLKKYIDDTIEAALAIIKHNNSTGHINDLNEITEYMVNSINPSKGMLRKERSSFSISTIGETKQDIADWENNLDWKINKEINKVCNKYADSDLWKIKLSSKQFISLCKIYKDSEVLYKKNGNSVINNLNTQNKEFEIVEDLENCIIIEPVYL